MMRETGYHDEVPMEADATQISRVMDYANHIVLWFRGTAVNSAERIYKDIEVDVSPDGITEKRTVKYEDIQIIDYRDDKRGREGVGFIDRNTGEKFLFENIARSERCPECKSVDIDTIYDNGHMLHRLCETCGNKF
jgi:hypothetical protein